MSTTRWRVISGDVQEVLPDLPDGSVQCYVTSPPYWGLRDYQTGKWEGGDPDCEHLVGGQVQDNKAPGSITSGQRPGSDAGRCRRSGARRVDSQIGIEPTPEAYVANMVAVLREVRRLLRDDGTPWLNLGDSYYNHRPCTGALVKQSIANSDQDLSEVCLRRPKKQTVLKEKDLVGIPWRVALALQADGWYLRQDIVWSKMNAMPESMRDRCTRSHEYIFLLTKKPHYLVLRRGAGDTTPRSSGSISVCARRNGRRRSRDGHAHQPRAGEGMPEGLRDHVGGRGLPV